MLNENGVKTIVIISSPKADAEREYFETHGFTVRYLNFEDGHPPPKEVLDSWVEIIVSSFPRNFKGKKAEGENKAIGVHCVAGMGRAPVLVGIGLIELGLKYTEAVQLIRSRRKGAINMQQLEYLKKYKPRSDSCVIM